MLKREFKALRVNDKVIITNKDHGLAAKRGTIVKVDTSDDSVKFVALDGSQYWFFAEYAKLMTITVERETIAAAPAPKKAPKGAQAYRGHGKHDWEVVAEGTERLRVPGGWLYTVETEDCASHATVFVPVPAVIGYAI